MKGLIPLIIYITCRFVFDFLWQKVSVYYSYLFELIFVSFTIYYLKIRPQFKLKQSPLIFLSLFFLGLFFHYLTGVFDLSVPFDFKNFEALIALLIIAPILEELVYRLALFESTRNQKLLKKNNIIFSACLFSFAHFMAFFIVPDEFKGFVIYQTFYTFILGFLVSYYQEKDRSIGQSIVLHFLFNFGFFSFFLITNFKN